MSKISQNPRTLDTRQKLMDAAVRLFAMEGVAQAQTRAITEQAGQRNASALHYHFGSREGLLAALMARHAEIMAPAALELLDAKRLGSRPSLPNVLRGLVLPLGDSLTSQTGQYYLLLHEQCLVQQLTLVDTGEVEAQLGQLLLERLRQALPWLPERTLQWRLGFVRQALAGALAARARGHLEGRGFEDSDEAFLEDLVEMLAAAIGAPVPLGMS